MGHVYFGLVKSHPSYTDGTVGLALSNFILGTFCGPNIWHPACSTTRLHPFHSEVRLKHPEIEDSIGDHLVVNFSRVSLPQVLLRQKPVKDQKPSECTFAHHFQTQCLVAKLRGSSSPVRNPIRVILVEQIR